MREICHTREADPAAPIRNCARRFCNTAGVELQDGLPTLESLLALPPALALSLVISLDGQLCGPDGSSRSISGPEDLAWLRRLRASSDAVITGASTAEREQYGPIRILAHFAAARQRHGLAAHPELVILRRDDDFDTVRPTLGPRLLLEAGVRLHTALARHIDRVWLSHSPTLVGDVGAAFALPFEGFTLAARHLGETFVVSRFERLSQHPAHDLGGVAVSVDRGGRSARWPGSPGHGVEGI